MVADAAGVGQRPVDRGVGAERGADDSGVGAAGEDGHPGRVEDAERGRLVADLGGGDAAGLAHLEVVRGEHGGRVDQAVQCGDDQDAAAAGGGGAGGGPVVAAGVELAGGGGVVQLPGTAGDDHDLAGVGGGGALGDDPGVLGVALALLLGRLGVGQGADDGEALGQGDGQGGVAALGGAGVVAVKPGVDEAGRCGDLAAAGHPVPECVDVRFHVGGVDAGVVQVGGGDRAGGRGEPDAGGGAEFGDGLAGGGVGDRDVPAGLGEVDGGAGAVRGVFLGAEEERLAGCVVALEGVPGGGVAAHAGLLFAAGGVSGPATSSYLAPQ